MNSGFVNTLTSTKQQDGNLIMTFSLQVAGNTNEQGELSTETLESVRLIVPLIKVAEIYQSLTDSLAGLSIPVPVPIQTETGEYLGQPLTFSVA